MLSPATEQPDPAPRRFRPRFSLLTLFLVVTATCVAFFFAGRAYWDHGCEATVTFQISSQPFALFGTAQFDAREFEVLRNSQIDLIKNPWLLQGALRDPAVASLSILADKPDKVDWLTKQLIVEFPGDGNLLAIRLRGGRDQAADVKVLLDAVAKAYFFEVDFREKQHRLTRIEAARRLVENLRERMRKGMEQVQASPSDSAETSAADKVQQLELDLLIEQWRTAANNLEAMEIDRRAPGRVQQLHQAISREW
jgi:hypothetical protein